MKVIMMVSITGTRNGQDWPRAGGAIDLPDAEAVDLLNAGMARPAPQPEPETAIVPDGSEKRDTEADVPAEGIEPETAIVPEPEPEPAKPRRRTSKA